MRQICPCKSALENGADLVLELPVVFSLSGAEGFAKAGVAIASAFKCTNYLAFGSESGDCELLKNPQTLFVMKGYRLLCVTE